MPIYNVTETTFDHICLGDEGTCQKAQQGIPHSAVQIIKKRGRLALAFLACEEHVEEHPKDEDGNDLCGKNHGCTIHIDCYNADLSPEDETAETRDEASREQVRNIRLLMHHLGIPRIEERQTQTA